MNIKSRPVYFSLMSLMFKILDMLEGLGDSRVSYYRYIVVSDAFIWFSMTPMYACGGFNCLDGVLCCRLINQRCWNSTIWLNDIL
jgi:hypothetical protein